MTRGELLRLRGSLDYARDDGAFLTLFSPNDTAFLLRSFCLIVQKKRCFFLYSFILVNSNDLTFTLHSIYPCFIQGLVSIFIILSSHLLNLPFSHPVIFIPFLFIYRCYNMLYL